MASAACSSLAQGITALALPRRPQSTWALTITSPYWVAIPRASSAEVTTFPGGMGMPARWNNRLPSNS